MSNFLKDPNQTSGREYILDTPEPSLNFLQFIPATVKHIINSKESAPNIANNPNESNMIVVEKSIFQDEVTLDGMQTLKYRPLIRGFSDSVVKGDEVLVTRVGDVGYYLGPLNNSNSPSSTATKSPRRSTEIISSNSYPYSIKQNRLVKEFNVELDDPDETIAHIVSPLTGNPILSDIHTDLVLEGRHGNSIRIGSRNRFPNLIIDNGRGQNQSIESINDSSIFGMFDNGSILEHFKPQNETLDGEEYAFRLSDESIESPSNYIKSTFTSPLGRGFSIDGEQDADIEETIYNYSNPFTILNSDRVIINARKENMFLSAFNHIHIGAGSSLTFSTSKNTIFNSTERFDINAPEIRLGSSIDEETEPIVLGDQLVIKLSELCVQLDGLIKNITAITVPTTQGPSGTPINAAAFSAQTNGIQSIKDTLVDFLSSTNRTT